MVIISLIVVYFLGFNPPKTTETKGKSFCKTSFKQGWICKKYRNKTWMKAHQKTTLLRNNGGKERQEDYPTSAAYAANVE